MKINLRLFLTTTAATLGLLALSSCGSNQSGIVRSVPLPSSSSTGEALPQNRPRSWDAAQTQRTESRPGLATTAGHDQYSSVQSGFFHRKATNQPDAMDSFHYNDEAGAKTMTGALGGGRRHSGLFTVAGNRLLAGLSDYSGEDYPHIEADGHRVVVGRSGQAYGVHLKNSTKKRLEVVVSVDSLDVLDGKAASARKNGYVLEVGQEYTIRGFRKNDDQVRQFTFGSVSESEAAKQEQARNVGLIGVAVYEEDEVAAKAARLAEALKRAGASAFPQSR